MQRTIPRVMRRLVPQALTVTSEAAKRLETMLRSKPDALGVLVGVKRRGCNGLAYTLNYADEQQIG